MIILLFIPYLKFVYTKTVTYVVENVGGGIGQDLTAEVTQLRLNQPPVFFQFNVLVHAQ